jgi:hypothetical protein
MNLTRLLNEIELLYRSEVQFGIPVRMTVAALVIDYLKSFDVVEPPMPTYPAYEWRKGVN